MVKQFGILALVFLLIALWQSLLNAHDEDKLEVLRKKVEVLSNKQVKIYSRNIPCRKATEARVGLANKYKFLATNS